jgi:hypothetical protein
MKGGLGGLGSWWPVWSGGILDSASGRRWVVVVVDTSEARRLGLAARRPFLRVCDVRLALWLRGP